jgi:hypothetical protein
MTPTEFRLSVFRNDFAPLPLVGKSPDVNGKGWNKKRLETNEGEIELWASLWPWADNTGIMGKFTPGLDIDIVDPDAAEAVETLAREHFEERGVILVRIGQDPKRLIPLRTDEPFGKIFSVLIAPNGQEHRIEIIADGYQWVAHGVHPKTHEPYRWHGGKLETTPREELPYVRGEDMQKFLDDAVQLLVAKFNYVLKTKTADNGEPHKPGEPQAEIERIAFALAVIPNDEDWDGWNNIGMATWRATGGSEAGLTAFDAWSKKSPKYHPHATAERWNGYFRSPPTQIGAGTVFYRADQASPNWWLDYQAKQNPPPPDPPPPEPEPQPEPKAAPLFDPWERFVVPDFPLHVLPAAVRDYVTSQSVVIGCDPSAMAMAALTAISGAIDHRFAVKMMRNGSWWEHPRLWTLLVGDPSRKKTPVINEVTRPLERHQNDLRRDYEACLRDYEAAKKEDKNADVEKPDPPVRYVVWDSTTEKLGEILSRSDHGLLVKRDEFSGWIGGMEKYSNARGAGADRGFWLQAYDGGPFAVDRVGRGEIHIGNLSVSLIGGIQPAKLIELHGLTSDGLLQRFVPVMMRASALPLDHEGDDKRSEYQRLVYKLIKARHQRFTLSDTALRVMNDLRAHLHKLEQAAGGLADGLQAFIGKLAGIAGRLAVILHMAANAENPQREIDSTTVAHVRALIVDFILPHAVEFYRSTEELSGGERLRKIASYILTSQQKTVTARDLVRNVHCLRGVSVLDLQIYVSPLVAAGWLDPAQPPPLTRTWTVSPIVASQFEEQRKTEEERKTLAAALMGSPRKPTEDGTRR